MEIPLFGVGMHGVALAVARGLVAGGGARAAPPHAAGTGADVAPRHDELLRGHRRKALAARAHLLLGAAAGGLVLRK